MIDTHCHIDLYKDPIQILKECESESIVTIGMTNLPSHFEMGYPHLLPFKKIRLALGMHPLYAEHHASEFNGFIKNLSRTSYIGEIGLDFSRDGITTKEIQVESFRKILKELKDKKKILSLHSRKAEKEVLNLLIENNIRNAIFHWYSGPLFLIEDILKAGYYFSVNPAMIRSKLGQVIIKKIAPTHVLTESDGPFIEIDRRPIKPSDVSKVIKYLSTIWNLSLFETENVIQANFMALIKGIK